MNKETDFLINVFSSAISKYGIVYTGTSGLTIPANLVDGAIRDGYELLNSVATNNKLLEYLNTSVKIDDIVNVKEVEKVSKSIYELLDSGTKMKYQNRFQKLRGIIGESNITRLSKSKAAKLISASLEDNALGTENFASHTSDNIN